MKERIVALTTALAVLLFASSASASPVIQIWSCDLIDGHSGADVIEASSDWLNARQGH